MAGKNGGNGNGSGNGKALVAGNGGNGSGYAISKIDIKSLQARINSALGSEGLSVNDLDRIKVPSGGGRTWTVPTVDGEVDRKEVDGVAILTQIVRSHYQREYNGGGEPPDCFSPDGITGIGKPGGKCDSCPMAQFGTAKNGTARGQACAMKRLIYMLLPHSVMPVVVSAPPTSLKNVKQYIMRLIGSGYEIHDVVSRLTLEKDKSSDGKEYSKITISKLSDSPDPEKIAAYVAAIKPYLERSAAAYARTGGASDADTEQPV